jgi:hypothetical protein
MKYRDFNVKVVLNGFIITIGCQQAVASTPKELVDLVKKYMDNPAKTEKEMTEKSLRFEESSLYTPFGAPLHGMVISSKAVA